MEGSPLSWFGLGNVMDRFDSFFDSFSEDLDKIIFQDAENQLVSARTSVKQFCTDLMEEMLPESIINTLKEKRPREGLSCPCPMEIVENETTDSSLAVENEFSLEEIRFRDTVSLTSNVNDDAQVQNLGDLLLADLEFHFPSIQMSSSISSSDNEQGTTAHTEYFSDLDLKKELLDAYKVATELSGKGRMEETAANRVSKAISETNEDKCIMMDSSKLCPFPDLHKKSPCIQGPLCTSCLKIESGDESVRARNVDWEAEFDGFGGNSIWVLPSDKADSEPDWVLL